MGFEGQHIYIICKNNENDRAIVEVIKKGSLSKCQFYYSTCDFKTVQDSLEIKRKISGSTVVIAIVNEKLMSDDQLQYELALAVDFNRALIVVRDGTTLPDIFEGANITDIYKDDDGRWVKKLEAAVEDEIIKYTPAGLS